MEEALTRRTFLKDSVLLAGSPLLPVEAAAGDSVHQGKAGAKKIVCVGAHPDDPESGCAGTLARYALEGHAVTVIYLTRGERGIRDKGLEEAARIRSAEAENACATLGARAVFFGQIDGATELARAQVESMSRLLGAEKPDVIFTHWPVDSHMDHQVASILTTRAWMALGETAQFYFFEVNSGSQSRGFFPNTYVDISSVLEKKKSALFAHVSQNGRGIWSEHHEIIASWRGREAGVAAAEAFVHMNRGIQKWGLPGIG